MRPPDLLFQRHCTAVRRLCYFSAVGRSDKLGVHYLVIQGFLKEQVTLLILQGIRVTPYNHRSAGPVVSGLSLLGVHTQILADQITISTRGRGERLCPSNNTGTPGLSDLPTTLCVVVLQLVLIKTFQNQELICTPTLESGINVGVRLLIFELFSRDYVFIEGGYV